MENEDPPAALIADADPDLAGWSDPLASLRRALDADELEVYCQPIRSLADGAENYPLAEILVRMREEEELLLPPGDFLPVFEHYRMMTDLDCWVVQKTAQWIGRSVPGSIPSYSVNVSSQSLDDARLGDYICQALADSGADPARLCLEIDEFDTLQRPDDAARFARAMHAIGCKVVIDGFARRSVSFAAVKSLQPAFIKIDGSVVRKIATSTVAQLKMKAIARVCGVAGIGMIAECVEEEQILLHLRDLSVGYAQGFGIAKPQPLEIAAMCSA